MFGIGISNFARTQKRCYKSVPFVLMMLLWTITLYKQTSQFYAYISDSKSYQSSLASCIIFVSGFFLWYYLFRFHLQICKTISRLKCVANVINTIPPEKFVRKCILFLIFLFFSRINMEIFGKKKSDFINNFQRQYFGMLNTNNVDWRLAAAKELSLEIIRDYMLFLFPNYFGFLLIVLFRYMTKIMYMYSELCKKGIKKRQITSNNYNTCFLRYKTILTLFNTINSILSVPIFLLYIFHATIIFLGTVIFLQSKFPQNLIFIIITSFRHLRRLLSRLHVCMKLIKLLNK